MSNVEILLFSTPTCGQCKAVKQMLDKNNVSYKHIDCTLDENEELVSKYNISHVPVLVFGSTRCTNINEVKEWINDRMSSEFFSALDIMHALDEGKVVCFKTNLFRVQYDMFSNLVIESLDPKVPNRLLYAEDISQCYLGKKIIKNFVQ